MRKRTKPTVALDFDGVIHEYSGWEGPVPEGPPLAGVQHALPYLAERARVVIYSSREPEVILAWLRLHDLLQYIESVGRTKPLCHVLLDDRGVRFSGVWNKELVEELLHFKTHWEMCNDPGTEAA